MSGVDLTTGRVIDAAVKLHKRIGPGLLESVYEVLLTRMLQRSGCSVERQKYIDINIDGIVFKRALRPDLIINNQVIVEVKSIERLAPVHSKQLLTYLRLMQLPVGLLINFGGVTLREGLHRVVTEHYRSPRL
jgi:iron complex transport system substrate-binding protein